MSKVNFRLIIFLIFFKFIFININAETILDIIDKQLLEKLKNQINKINEETKGVWEAGINRISLLPKKEFRKLLGVPPRKPNHTEENKPRPEYLQNPPPQDSCYDEMEFDPRVEWSGCANIIGKIQNQGPCGSCWAVSTTSSFQDRYCIQLAKAGRSIPPSDDPSIQFSALDMVTCYGNWPSTVLRIHVTE
ncbi:hypothetical protein ACQ4LE_010881 [Meloidogyne hapla]|uniref:Pept_C1 domain-containing protein n=1 Tax=Meloidogyne hapla TaxID=6305 RepID=A0A1I8B2W8_MELHA